MDLTQLWSALPGDLKGCVGWYLQYNNPPNPPSPPSSPLSLRGDWFPMNHDECNLLSECMDNRLCFECDAENSGDSIVAFKGIFDSVQYCAPVCFSCDKYLHDSPRTRLFVMNIDEYFHSFEQND